MISIALVDTVAAEDDCYGGNVVKERGEGGEGVGGDTYPRRSCSMGLQSDQH
jgi:hypothetical protein